MTVGVVLGWGSAGIQDMARIVDLGFAIVAIVPEGDATALDMAARLNGICPVVNQHDMAERRPLSGIVTFADDQVLNTSRLALELGLQCQHPVRVAIRLTDKLVQRRVLAAVSPVKFSRADMAAQKGLVPAVVKPRRATGGFGLRRARSEAELRAALTSIESSGGLTNFLVEEELAGLLEHPVGRRELADYVSVEVCSIGGASHVFAIGDKLRLTGSFRETGTIYPSGLPEAWQALVAGLALRAVSVLGIEWGISHVEVKLTPQGPRIIEVNGRLGGGVSRCLRLAGRLDPTALAIAVAAGMGWDEGISSVRVAGSAQVCGQALITPPEGRHILKEVPNRAEVRALPGVSGYTQLSRPGSTLDSSVGQRAVVGEVFTVGDDYHEILTTISQLDTTLRRHFIFDAL